MALSIRDRPLTTAERAVWKWRMPRIAVCYLHLKADAVARGRLKAADAEWFESVFPNWESRTAEEMDRFAGIMLALGRLHKIDLTLDALAG